MGRSVKKGPFVQPVLLKRIQEMNQAGEKKIVKTWSRASTIFPDKPITEKPAETRMGSGKGSPEYWVAVVKPGRVMFETGGVSEELAREALRLAANKLPIKCKFVSKKDQETGGDQQ